MKKYGIGKRILSLLLAAVLVLSAVPTSVYAATIGAIVSNGNKGTTGLTGNIDTGATISWPIKIYDYLNDGMLFEYSSNTATSVGTENSWLYGGGEQMPEQNIIGNDFTIYRGYRPTISTSTGLTTGNASSIGSGAYGRYAYTNWLANETYSPYENSVMKAGSGTPGAFKYLHLEMRSGQSAAWTGMSSPYSQGLTYNQHQMRYAVIVYRSNISNPQLNLGWSCYASTYGTGAISPVPSNPVGGTIFWDRGAVTLAADKDQWNYAVIDMNNGTIATKWSNITRVNTVIFKIENMTAGTDFFDISHVAYFSTNAEATNYGKDAANFSNNPGEYLPDQQEVTTPYVPPTTDEEPTPVAAPTKVTHRVVDFTEQGTVESKLITNWSGSAWGWTITQQTSNNKSYIRLSDSDASIKAIPVYRNQGYSGDTCGFAKSSARYVTLVYRTHNFTSGTQIGAHGIESTATATSGFYFNRYNGANDVVTGKENLTLSESTWVYLVYDMYQITSYTDEDDYTNVQQIAFVFPQFAGGTQSIDIAYVDFNSTPSAAKTFGEQAVAYMNDPTAVGSTTTTTPTYGKGYKHWNMGSNVGFTMMFPAVGGGWSGVTWEDTDGNSYNSGRGANSKWDINGYYDYSIGEWLKGTGLLSSYYNLNGTRTTSTMPSDYVVSDSIYSLYFDKSVTAGYNTKDLALGYQLLTTGHDGLVTMGLLESSLGVVTKDNWTYKILQYKDDTIDYIAQLLEATLTIPQKDIYGNYNYDYVMGGESSQFAYTYNASTGAVTEGITVNGVAKSKVDLATGLRTRLGITFQSDKHKAVTQPARGTAAGLTAEKRGQLIGTFQECLPYIETFADAAYYLLHNLFVDNSYNQVQDEYNYLVLSKATTTAGKEAYVFDAGFSTGISANSANAGYADTSESAVVYNKTAGTISLKSANSKDWIYSGTSESSRTTRFPFDPVTDATGDYYNHTSETYFAEDVALDVVPGGVGYANRNYNYVMQANGEFVFHVDDDLFFDFEGDDDVYLFINGELVLDIGGAHSITKVGFNMNDYVSAARAALVDNADLPGYYSGMSNSEFEALLKATSLSAEEKEEYTRWYKLDLVDGQSYEIDFYYMERHGYGANMRVATNIVMTDPSMQTNKTAYQNGEEIPYGGVADKNTLVEYGFSITNSGNNKLYDLTFTDSTLGVTMDKTNGLVVSGAAVDKDGGTLDVSDLVINISGYSGPNYSGPLSIDITLADQTALKKFMEDLESGSTETQESNGLYAGSGLWKDGTVTIRGIYVNLNDVSVSANQFSNTVETTAGTAIDSATKLNGKDTHMLRTLSDGIQFYQWAGHELGITRQEVFDQLTDNAKRGLLKGTETSTSSLKATWMWMVTCRANGVEYSWSNISVDDEKSAIAGTQGHILRINYQKPGKNVFYLKIWRNAGDGSNGYTDSYTILPVTVYVANVQDSALVLDYGLKAELTGTGGIYTNDSLKPGANSTHTFMGITATAPAYNVFTYDYYNAKKENRIDFAPASGNVASGDGNYYVDSSKLYFQPTDFMDGASDIYGAVTVHETGVTPTPVRAASADGNRINIAKEVQMYQKITVVPANVVYYEDDFPAIEYADETADDDLTSANTFTKVTGSDSISQSVNQNTAYGSDPTYQTSTNKAQSGGRLTTITINDANPFARFSFKGTGFEIISKTTTSSGTMEVVVYSVDDEGVTTEIRRLPVITEFDNANNGDGGNEVIYQVPVIRVDDLTYGNYIVKIAGVPKRAAENSTLTTVDISTAYKNGGITDAVLDSWKASGKIIAAQYTELKALSADGTARMKRAIQMITPAVVKSKLYIDGIRIYKPLGATNENYNDNENGATFVELRDLILDRKVAFVTYDHLAANTDETTKAISTGYSTWVENHTGKDFAGTTYTNNRVQSLTDYLVAGPNNEVYMKWSSESNIKHAMVFYVSEDEGTDVTHSLQIGFRYLDQVLFNPKSYSGTYNYTNLRYAVATGGDYGTYGTLALIDQVRTSAEQYYTIDYTKCPQVTFAGDNKTYYEVVLLGTYSIGAFTNLKYNGLTLKTDNQYKGDEVLEWQYVNGVLTLVDTATGEVDTGTGFSLRYNHLFNLMETDLSEDEPETVAKPNLTLKYPSLNFQDEIYYNVYYSVDDLTNVVEMGLITFNEALTDGTIDNAVDVIPGYTASGDYYMSHTNGIPAKKMGDTLYFKAYAKLSDGTYAYSDVQGYSALSFAKTILAGNYEQKTKSLMVAMLNYGAAAQVQFGYNTDKLMNADLTEAQKAYVDAYSSDMVSGVPAVDSAKAGLFVATETGYGEGYPAVAFDGAFAINYYFPVTNTPNGDVKLYYWRAADFEAAEVLTVENATGAVEMTETDGIYRGSVTGIAAKEVDEIIYVASAYESDGVTYCTGVIAYSLSAYCRAMSNRADTTANAKALAEQTAVYGYYAKQYFA